MAYNRTILIPSFQHYDIDHAGEPSFTKAQYIVQRCASSGWRQSTVCCPSICPDQPMEHSARGRGAELLPGLKLIETSGHVPGHQSVLVQLPQTGAILLTVDAVPFGAGFTRDDPDDGSNPNGEAGRASTLKLLDLVEREQIGLVIFGHDNAQWETLKKAPAFYE
ncbi:MAG: hypothetical protein U0175_05130 [Caldilineaceae bacterium]